MCRTVKLLCRGTGSLSNSELDSICAELRERGYTAPEVPLSTVGSATPPSKTCLPAGGAPLRIDTDPHIFNHIVGPLLDDTSLRVLSSKQAMSGGVVTSAEHDGITFADDVNVESRGQFAVRLLSSSLAL